jgi:hypothetical protein
MQPGRIGVELDSQKLTGIRWPKQDKRLWLIRRDKKWRVAPKPPPRLKGPQRYGAFKDAFRNRAVLVYGTGGNAEENAWSFAKARYDAESFWYRGNGAFEVVADTDFDPQKYADRNVVVYGNAATNTAWPKLLSTSAIQVRRDTITIGASAFETRRERGDDLACLFILPRQDSETASVAVVSGTGITGMRLTNRLRYFVSGVAYPDLAIFGPDVLTTGTPAVRTLGYFGDDWTLESGDFVWRDVAL